MDTFAPLTVLFVAGEADCCLMWFTVPLHLLQSDFLVLVWFGLYYKVVQKNCPILVLSITLADVN